MEDHPGIVLRDGQARHRAALAGGPDVREVVATLKGTGLAGEQAGIVTAEWGALTHALVHAAVRYHADFRDEVDERIAHNSQEAERQRGTGLQWPGY